MKHKRYNLVGVVENVFEDRDMVWPGNGIMEKVKIMKPIEGKIDIKKINRGLRRKITIDYIRDKIRKFRI